MNGFYQTHLTDNSIRNICRRFHERYADRLTQTVTPARATELLGHVQECLGGELPQGSAEGQQFVALFAADPARGVTYEDLEQRFLRYLSGPAAPGARSEPPVDPGLRYDQRAQLEQELEEARGRRGPALVELQLRTGRQAFARADRDRDGLLAPLEARALVRDLLGEDNALLRDEEVDALVEQLDADRDGRVSQLDFDLHLLRSL